MVCCHGDFLQAPSYAISSLFVSNAGQRMSIPDDFVLVERCFIYQSFSHTQCRNVNEVTWEKCVRSHVPLDKCYGLTNGHRAYGSAFPP